MNDVIRIVCSAVAVVGVLAINFALWAAPIVFLLWLLDVI